MSTSPSSQSSALPGAAPGRAVAVLTAAGSGSRLGANVPKALVPVGGTSLLRRATAGLIDAGVVSHLVVTAPADDVERFRAELAGLLDGSSGGALNGTGETVPTRTSWVGTTVEVVSGPLGTGTMGCDEGVGSEALRGLDRPEPGTLRGADDGLGLPRLTGLDLLDGVGDG